jgi:DNA (cytosine-5)-methyltransferase 1
LIVAHRLTPGRIDDRSIRDVKPADLAGATRAHFFAGIGGWDLALQLAGWPDDVPVWTGSCPCQPFSSAGKKAGFSDDRHLWPVWFDLIRECRPPVIFGEQVTTGSALDWLDLVCSDLEGEGYAVGAADLAAASVGAPHKRQRLYWVAYAGGQGLRRGQQEAARRDVSGGGYAASPVAYAGGVIRRLPVPERGPQQEGAEAVWYGQASPLGYTNGESVRRDAGAVTGAQAQGWDARVGDDACASGPDGFWSGPAWVQCSDGRSRPTEPGVSPLVNGIPSRVGKLRGFGNAIVPPLAAAFIKASMTTIGI